MRRFLGTYLKTFFFANLGFLLVAVAVKAKLNITYGYAAFEIGAILFSLFVALGVRILLARKGNPVANAILGLLVVLPGVLVLRPIFSLAVFRFSFVLYLVLAIAAVAYAAAVLVVSARAKKETDALNRMLSERPRDSERE
ncbi:MAG: hypothetical protein WC509_03305 [Candidatus Izemoplasmatales bacterium]